MRVVLPSPQTPITWLVLSLSSLWCATGSASPRWLRVTFVGDSAREVAISWNTLSGPAGNKVEYGTRAGHYSFKATASIRKLAAAFGEQSEAHLGGLSPDTTYHYRVGGGSAGWSKPHRFRTGPASHPRCGKVRLAYVGDSRAEAWQGDKGVSDLWSALLRRIRDHSPLMLLHGGDFVHEGKSMPQYVNLLRQTAFFSADVPIVYSLGNHDDGPGQGEGALYNQLFALPRSDEALGGSGTEDFFAFEAGNTLLVGLSTSTFVEGDYPFERQAKWLDRVLSKSDKLWTIVFMHHPIYTQYLLINHKPNEVDQNRAFVSIFNKHHVDLVIGSHNHFYERWAPSRCSDPGRDSPCPTTADKGTVYLTSGGGGAFPIFAPGATDSARLATSGKHHFLLIDIADHRLRIQAIDDGGRPIDRYELKKTPRPSGCKPAALPPVANPPAASDGCGCHAATGDGAATGSSASCLLLLVLLWARGLVRLGRGSSAAVDRRAAADARGRV